MTTNDTQQFIIKWIFLSILTIISACHHLPAQPFDFSSEYHNGDTYMKIRLRGSLALAPQEVDGIPLAELSGLGWDEDEGLLYAIADRGHLYHLIPTIVDNILTDIKVLRAYFLKNAQGKRLKGDSEGLTLFNERNGIRGDSELLISFERQPRLQVFSPQGHFRGERALPKILKDIKNYDGKNKSLEAVTTHPKWDILTAPEWPLKETVLPEQRNHTLYSLKGCQWTFSTHSAPNSAIVAMETLEDQSILVLERAFVAIYKPLVISLRQLWLPNCQLGDDAIIVNKIKTIAIFSNAEGWRVDNFEGLSRHQGHYFFMVSDNNDNELQRTLLNYFEILP